MLQGEIRDDRAGAVSHNATDEGREYGRSCAVGTAARDGPKYHSGALDDHRGTN